MIHSHTCLGRLLFWPLKDFAPVVHDHVSYSILLFPRISWQALVCLPPSSSAEDGPPIRYRPSWTAAFFCSPLEHDAGDRHSEHSGLCCCSVMPSAADSHRPHSAEIALVMVISDVHAATSRGVCLSSLASQGRSPSPSFLKCSCLLTPA